MDSDPLHPASPSLHSLAGEITHILHLAWPMDFQLTLPSLRPHLTLLQSLLHLAHTAGTVRPGVRVRVVFTSSIAAVRHFPPPRDQQSSVAVVPEAAVPDPSAALPMGYAEGKWVCEQMMAAAARHGTVEPVVVRVGQLSGPQHLGDGVWKTGEHVPVLVRACCALGAWPDLDGTASWLPVDCAARCLAEMLLACPAALPGVLHLENPVRQPMRDLVAIMAREVEIVTGRPAGMLLPFDAWMKRAVDSGAMVASLEEFFRDHFRALGQGSIVLDTTEARAVSKSLRGQGGVGKDVVTAYVRQWKRDSFLA